MQRPFPADPAGAGASVADWYERGHRDLPWRHTSDPYAIWVSEIMLQQTQAATVIPYYERFLERFPTVRMLAEADQDEVLLYWKGLGYYRRALNLHKGARYIVSEFDGEIPADYSAILKIPGIGAYTAGAVASFAFGIAAPAVDGNVTRIIARLCAMDAPLHSGPLTRAVTETVRSMIPPDRAYAFNQGMIELGAVICKPARPQCEVCPLANICYAWQDDTVEQYPVRPAGKEKKKAEIRILLIRDGNGNVLLRKRPQNVLMAGMWSFPASGEGVPDAFGTEQADVLSYKHVFTHLIWNVSVTQCIASEHMKTPPDCRWVSVGELSNYAVPSAYRPIVEFLET